MSKRWFASSVLAAFLAVPALLAPAVAPAAPQPLPRLELASVMGRWYEVARIPNQLQRGCTAGASDWTPTAEGFAVVQSCHKGAPDGPLAEWRAKARVADASNARFRMSFFGGLVSQEYWVLDQRPAEGWLILSTRDGRYLWLMAQRPTLPAPAKADALARIRQLGFDTGRLEFPQPGRG
jgi:apolipoprotein D and lipocalin family protein